MRLSQTSIARLMVVVAVAAGNLAVGRLMYQYDLGLVFQVAPMGLVCQYALFRFAMGLRGSRRRWAGVFVSSIALMAFSMWLVMSRAYQWEIAHFWMTITSVIAPSAAREENRLVLGSLFLLIWTLPQIVLAMIGGAILQFVGSRIAACPSSDQAA